LNRTRGFVNQNRFRSSKAVKKLGKATSGNRQKKVKK
jgi:hypothetical protein